MLSEDKEALIYYFGKTSKYNPWDFLKKVHALYKTATHQLFNKVD